MILASQHIRARCTGYFPYLIEPFEERGVFMGMSYGLGPATYDCRVRQSIALPAFHGFVLASTIEKVNMPNDLRATVCDKSSWARRGITVQNTKIDPGFRGHITIEITNHSAVDVMIKAGMPILQLEFAQLLEPTDMPYQGKYQNQPDEVVPYREGTAPWK